MTQIPHVSDPYGYDHMSEPTRTSLMAIMSMVLSLIGCCLPIGFLGAILGVFSLVGISASHGRVTGKGFAVAGIIIGVVNTVIQVSLFMGLNKFFGVYQSMTEVVYLNLEADDFDGARRSLSGAAATTTDEQFIAFREAYRAELGSFQRVSSGWGEVWSDFMEPEVGPNMASFQGRQDLIPIPGHFDQGLALLVFQIDQRQTGGIPVFEDLFVVLGDGTQIVLSDFAGATPVPPVLAPVDPAKPDVEEEDDEG